MAWRVSSLVLLVLLVGGELRAQVPTLARVDTIVPDSAARHAARTLTELLRGAVPGLMVRRPSGATTSGAYLTMRSLRSYRRNAEPLIVVDGIRVDGSSGWVGVETGGVAPTRLDDFAVDDIETIEVLKGPATAALYGIDAADGVIVITTKRPKPGSRAIRGRAAAGLLHETTSYPASYGIDPEDGRLISFNPLEQVSPFRTGSRQEAMLGIDGATTRIGLYARGSAERELGVLANDDLTRTSGRVTVTGAPHSSLRVELGTHYVRSRLHLPFSGEHGANVLFNALIGGPRDDPVNRGYVTDPPDVLLKAFTAQNTDRVQGALKSEWRPASWLTHTLVLGVDRTEREEHQLLPAGSGAGGPFGFRTRTRQRSSQWFGSTMLGLRYRLSREISGQTLIGADLLRLDWDDTLRLTFAESEAFSLLRIRPTTREMTGALAAQQIEAGRFAAAIALRTDDPGEQMNRTWHPAVSVRWRIRDHGTSLLGRLTVRGAAGESSRQPSGLGDPSQSECGTCAPLILLPHVERTRELDGGLDATVLGDRVDLALTVYRQATRNVMLMERAPLNLPHVRTTEGRTTNLGIEIRSVARLHDGPSLGAAVEVGVWANRNRLDDVGRLFPTFPLGPQTVAQKGRPLAGFRGRPYGGFVDRDGDGRLTLTTCWPFSGDAHAPTCEIVYGEFEYLGSSLPTRELTITPRLRLGTSTTAGVQFGYLGGHKLYNRSEWIRCLLAYCQGARDPNVSEAEKFHVAMVVERHAAPLVQDASNWQLRELWLRHAVPRRWIDRLGVQAMSVSLVGRNLATWSAYRGFHPDASSMGSHPYLLIDSFVQPPVRSVTARVEATW